ERAAIIEADLHHRPVIAPDQREPDDGGDRSGGRKLLRAGGSCGHHRLAEAGVPRRRWVATMTAIATRIIAMPTVSDALGRSPSCSQPETTPISGTISTARASVLASIRRCSENHSRKAIAVAGPTL